MKILTQSPKDFCSEQSSDLSRVGNQAESVYKEKLHTLPHGIVLLGLADDTGIHHVKGRPGASLGPAAVRKKLYKFTSGKLNIPLYDLGDLQANSSIEKTHDDAVECITAIHEAGHMPLVLGGGHDLAFCEAKAFLDAHPEEKLGVLNIDAHLDLRPAEPVITSGSPWYLLLETPGFNGALVEFGIQKHCNSDALFAFAEKKKVKIIELALQKALTSYEKELSTLGKKYSVQVSLDIDSVRSSEAPGCSAPQTLGFTAEEAIAMSRLAGQKKFVKSFGIYELSPPLDVDNRTAALVAHCALAFIQAYATRFPIEKKRGKKNVQNS